MEKLTINIDPENWGNLITKYNPHSPKLTENDFTAGTINLDTDTVGSLAKRKGGPNYNPTLLSSAPKDQYEAIFSDGVRHLLVVTNGTFYYSSGDTIFNAVTNGSGFSTGGNFEFATTQDRVYGGNAINAPIIYDRNAIYGGAAPVTVPRIRTMGVQVPATFVAATVAAGGAVPIGSHNYKTTFVYYDSEESNGSPAMGAPVTTTAGNQTINLTSVPIGGYGVTQRKIYRDNNDGNYLHVGTISNNTATTFSDVLIVGVTPTPIPTNNGTAPSFGLISLWLDRLWVAQVPGDPNTLFYSEAALPDIFGAENQVLCNQEDPITALVVYFDRLVVFNRRSMGQIIGDTPDSFRYSAIPSSVGCVDNRTLQTHVLKGVPVLIWLSERGFYTYDGNAIDYISDPIEDLVNYNIRQALQQKNSNAQTSFTSGTSSNGIDSTLLSSDITTRGYNEGTSSVGNNPRRNWNDSVDWENGSSKINVVTTDGTNLLKTPTRFAPTLESGSLSNAIIDAGNLKLQVHPLFTGQGYNYEGAPYNFLSYRYYDRFYSTTPSQTGLAIPFTPARNGNMWAMSILGDVTGFFSSGTSNYTYKLKVWQDGGGYPGSVVWESSTISVTFSGSFNYPFQHYQYPAGVSLTGGTKYWFGYQLLSASNYGNGFSLPFPIEIYPYLIGGGLGVVRNQNGWTYLENTSPVRGTGSHPYLGYGYNESAYPKSGSWVSPIYDSSSSSISSGISAALTATYPTGSYPSGSYSTSSLTRIEASNDSTMVTGVVFEDINNLSGSSLIALSAKRYWRIRVTLSSTDDRATPTANSPIVKFNVAGIWISETIDVTSDIVSLDSFITSQTIPSGTSVVYTIATSADDITYPDGFVTFGTQTNRRYVKIRAILTATSDDATTPSISSIALTWTLTANYVSPIIDTAVAPPAGWDIFLAQFDDNGGTVQFQMRSATTSGGIPSATFYTVSPGDFPTLVAPLQFVQWKAIITSSDSNVPDVSSVTIQWFLSLVASIRPASIFVDGRYYVALAELNQTVNNLIIQLDLNGKWRRFSGISVATFSFFFNRPYYGLSTSGQIRRFLEGYSDGGVAIEFDVRTKAFDFSTKYKEISEKQKVIGEIIVHAKNTGALLQFFYSPDEGQTFYPFCTLSGATSYQTTATGNDFFLRLKPIWTGVGTPQITGQHMMYRLYNNDTFPVEIHSLKATIFVRKQPPVITG